VGGDLYDVIEPVDGKVGVFIGDVSGKGVSAALYMAKIISDFRYNALTVESPEIVMNRLNAVLSKAPRGMFLTATYMIIDTLTGSLKVSVAGHPPFVWISKNDAQAVSVLSGPPLGIVPDEYPSSTLSLHKGDKLLMLTDGVFDAKSTEGQRIGFNTIVRFIKKHKDEKHLADVVTDYVRVFSKGAEMADDLTIVEVTFS
jgi:sigma-B regulation protein RsbU (phosphoserine phosphatase)